MNLLRSVSLLALAGAAAASQAALTVYTDRAQFLAALGTTTTETFDTDLDPEVGDNFYNGVNYRQTGTDTFGDIVGGRFENDQDDAYPYGTEIVFGSAVRGFGADFDDANTASGLAFTINGERASLADFLPDPGTGFFGIVSDADFTTVTFSNATPNDGRESYSFDNLTYGTAGAAPSVPGPLAALPFALMVLKRRKRA